MRSPTLNGYSLLRVITKTLDAQGLESAWASIKQLKVHPLAEEVPAGNRFIDPSDNVFDAIPRFDASFYDALARLVAEEPLLERDQAILDRSWVLNDVVRID